MRCGLGCGCEEAQAARDAIKVIFDISVVPSLAGAGFDEPEPDHDSVPRGVLGAMFLKTWAGHLASQAGRIALEAKRRAKENSHA